MGACCVTLLFDLQGFGYAVGLLGFFLYNYIKMQQMDKPEPNRKLQYTSLPQTDPSRDSNKPPQDLV